MTISPVMDARRESLPPTFGAVRPFMPLSSVVNVCTASGPCDTTSRAKTVRRSPPAAALARVNLTNVVATGARVEYFHDPGQVIIVTGNLNGIRTLGASLNLDFALAESAVFRLEGRMFRDARELYMLGKNPSQTNIAATASLTLAFDHLLDLTPSASEE